MTTDGDNKRDEPNTSPFGRKLFKDLQEAGDTGLSRSKLKTAGAEKELKRLCALGYAVSLDGAVFLAAEAYRRLARAIVKGKKPGTQISITDARTSTGLSRRYLLPILNRMESEGYLKRSGDMRIVLDLSPHEGGSARGDGK
ncbi:MAG: SelB C-terminal domain-containing protein [Spirochaetales bacterium]|nr:SelB C-terminal domain-containing protein [Spirochaetales bacterium]